MYEKLIAAAVGIGSVAAVGAAGYLGRKLHNLTKKVGKTVDDLAKAEEKDIQDELVELSVRKAAERKVDRYAREAASQALAEVRSEVKNQVKNAVSAAFDDVKTSVEKEISSQVSAIDHHALKKDVTEQAKKMILEKFDGNLDDILKDFSDNLDRVKKIYSSISDTLSERKDGKEIRLNIG